MVFEATATENHAPIVFAEDQKQIISLSVGTKGIEYYTKSFGILSGELNGIYQEKNTNTILCAIQQLESLGYMHTY